ncbi:MAG: hypothetical protein HYX75_21555 [Acidobacteria bacterium]|nr:hypothetical protein [Acidobacteriota bacterium]
MIQHTNHRRIALLCMAGMLIAAAQVCTALWRADTEGQDIYFAWVEGRRLLAGENPYERVLSGDMRKNAKYATYFPIFYEFSAVTQAMGLRQYPDWIAVWRLVFMFFYLGVACVLFSVLSARGQPLAGILAAAFWLFNRWSLGLIRGAHLDFIPIFLLLLSLGIYARHRRASLLLYGMSLGFKQIAIFLAPLYLIRVWREAAGSTDTPGQDARASRARASVPLPETPITDSAVSSSSRGSPRRSGSGRIQPVLAAGVLIILIPLATSIPFLVWNAEGYVRSILFSVTRSPDDHFGIGSLDSLLGWSGFPARLPMLSIMLLVYALFARGRIGMLTGALLVMAIFVDFNSVLFPQYVLWIVPLIPLIICDTLESSHPGKPSARAEGTTPSTRARGTRSTDSPESHA